MAGYSFQRRRDRKAYRIALWYLLKTPGVTQEVLDTHLSFPVCDRPDTLAGVYWHLAFTAQNYQSLPQVIGCQIGDGDVGELSALLCDFDPAAVLGKYGEEGWESLLDDVDATFFPHKPRSRGPHSLWKRYCKAVLSGAKFLTGFRDAEHFYAWVAEHDASVQSRYELAITLGNELHGFREALACDFVKELGFPNWSKPDVHLKKIFVELRLAESEDECTVFEAIDRFARNNDVSPYHADKVFWLISSGRFYRSGMEVSRRRDRFIRVALKNLDK